MLQITTLGELADALKELAEAESAQVDARNYMMLVGPHGWQAAAIDEDVCARRVAELRAAPVRFSPIRGEA